MARDPLILRHRTKQLLSDASGARLLTALLDAQAARGVAHIVLTGGSMGSAILASLAASPARDAVDWSAVHVWWGDERYLPTGDPDRNETQNRAALLDEVPLVPANIHSVDGPDTAASAEESASRYAAQLAAAAAPGAGSPTFDVVMLGVGPDGHVASLFPHHPGLDGVDPAIAVHDSPKPPPDRVSLTFPTLNTALEVWFLVAGADKADAVVGGITTGDVRSTPAAGVYGIRHTLWLLDDAAASGLA